MASAAQITANRANSQLCTGPKTDAGKERSSQNALKHGLFSRRVVLPQENQEEYDTMLAEMTAHYQPVGPQEANFVREVVDNYWKLQRARRVEQLMMDSRVTSDADLVAWVLSDDYQACERVARQIGRLQNAWYRSMSCLDKLQAARKREQLRATRETAAEARKSAAEARKAAADSRRKSDEMIRELLSPSDYREEIGFVPPISPVAERLIAAGVRAGVL